LDRMQLPIPAINPSYLFEKMPIQLIPKLIHARNKMRNQEYGEVFDEMLTADLSSELGFAHFAMASPDGSEIAQKLTRHNQSILTDLTSAGIDVQQAMYYDKKIYFQYAGGGVVDLNQQISSIWTSFTLTKQRITGLDLELKKLLNFPEEYPKELSVLGKEVNDLSAMMDNFEKRLLSNKNTDFVYEAVKTALIKDVSLKVHIDKISRKIDRIQACLPNEILPISTLSGSEAQLKKEQRYFIKIRDALIPFYTIKSTVAEQLKRIIEQGNHFTNYYNRLESDSSRVRNAQKVLSTKTRYFRVERWDKNKLLTFFLGDMLSCCLASDGAYFEAMVQRRMDIAMFMDVVIDERTGLPVCGNWLFWGEDIYKPDDIYVVANFFEINAGIGSNQQLNKTLVDHLLYFTGDFSKNVGAKGLIIRPLTYGQIPDFQQFREEKEIKIKKIGGCLDESEVELLLESLDDSALLLKNIQRMAKNVIDKTKEFMVKVPSCSTVEKLRETLSELNAKIAALNNVVLEITAQEIMLAKQKTILNHYNQFKKCVHQLKQQLLELSTLDDHKEVALLLNRIIQLSIALIEAHEGNNNAAVINHYYLESLKLQHFYYYDVAAMEQSEVFNPSCQRDIEVEIAVNANQNGPTRA
jgi:hypothetical protein